MCKETSSWEATYLLMQELTPAQRYAVLMVIKELVKVKTDKLYLMLT